jgi:hypothetical protein
MIAILLILNAFLWDLATFAMAVEHYGMAGEWGLGASWIVATAGMAGLVAAKVAGALFAALYVNRFPRWLPLAAGPGLLGAATNVSALVIA